MAKTLSEQICKICGIEPKLKGEAIQLYDEYYKKFADKILPDFTKPENFVKLLEIMTDQSTEERLSRFVRQLRVESGDLVYGKKQAIRKTEWDWE